MGDLLELVSIGDAIDRRIGTYSGGMKRRLDLAAALVHEPEVLFLDEPTTGLDPTSRAAVWNEVRYLNEELGLTILLTTQYLEEADALANRVGIIARGKLVAEVTPDELKRSIGSDLIVARVAAGSGQAAADAVAELAQVERTEIAHDPAGDEVVMSVADGVAAISPVAIAHHQPRGARRRARADPGHPRRHRHARSAGVRPHGRRVGARVHRLPVCDRVAHGQPDGGEQRVPAVFPFAFLTTAYLPQQAMTGWLASAVKVNPTTYLLEGTRALLQTGWE